MQTISKNSIKPTETKETQFPKGEIWKSKNRETQEGIWRFTSWEAWKFELQAKFVVEESDIAVAEAAATEAAKSPHFFIIARRWKNLFPGNQNFGEHKYVLS